MANQLPKNIKNAPTRTETANPREELTVKHPGSDTQNGESSGALLDVFHSAVGAASPAVALRESARGRTDADDAAEEAGDGGERQTVVDKGMDAAGDAWNRVANGTEGTSEGSAGSPFDTGNSRSAFARLGAAVGTEFATGFDDGAGATDTGSGSTQGGASGGQGSIFGNQSSNPFGGDQSDGGLGGDLTGTDLGRGAGNFGGLGNARDLGLGTLTADLGQTDHSSATPNVEAGGDGNPGGGNPGGGGDTIPDGAPVDQTEVDPNAQTQPENGNVPQDDSVTVNIVDENNWEVWAGAAGQAGRVFRTSYEVTRGVIDGLKEMGVVDIDEEVTELAVGFTENGEFAAEQEVVAEAVQSQVEADSAEEDGEGAEETVNNEEDDEDEEDDEENTDEKDDEEGEDDEEDDEENKDEKEDDEEEEDDQEEDDDGQSTEPENEQSTEPDASSSVGPDGDPETVAPVRPTQAEFQSYLRNLTSQGRNPFQSSGNETQPTDDAQPVGTGTGGGLAGSRAAGQLLFGQPGQDPVAARGHGPLAVAVNPGNMDPSDEDDNSSQGSGGMYEEDPGQALGGGSPTLGIGAVHQHNSEEEEEDEDDNP